MGLSACLARQMTYFLPWGRGIAAAGSKGGGRKESAPIPARCPGTEIPAGLACWARLWHPRLCHPRSCHRGCVTPGCVTPHPRDTATLAAQGNVQHKGPRKNPTSSCSLTPCNSRETRGLGERSLRANLAFHIWQCRVSQKSRAREKEPERGTRPQHFLKDKLIL